MRGEYAVFLDCLGEFEELPPRARRILVVAAVAFVAAGTTSACAENTRHVVKSTPYFWNYLRVRGEYQTLGEGPYGYPELPPRARRIP